MKSKSLHVNHRHIRIVIIVTNNPKKIINHFSFFFFSLLKKESKFKLNLIQRRRYRSRWAKLGIYCKDFPPSMLRRQRSTEEEPSRRKTKPGRGSSANPSPFLQVPLPYHKTRRHRSAVPPRETRLEKPASRRHPYTATTTSAAAPPPRWPSSS